MTHAFIILAAGNSTRFGLNKINALLLNKPIVSYSIELAKMISEDVFIVLQDCNNFTKNLTDTYQCTPVYQPDAQGTGHALMLALASMSDAFDCVTVLLADCPLITLETLQALMAPTSHSAHFARAAVMEATGQYGRLLVQQDQIINTCEYKDARFDPSVPGLCWTGAVHFALRSDLLLQYVQQLQFKHNELYLTDLFTTIPTYIHKISQEEGIGINTKQDYALARQYLLKRIIKSHHQALIIDPNSTVIDQDSILEPGCIIEPNTYIYNSHIKSNSVVKPFSYIQDSTIDGHVGPFAYVCNNSHIVGAVDSFTHVDNSIVQNGTVRSFSHITNRSCINGSAGPFSYTRCAEIQTDASIGAFVEVKSSTFEAFAKAKHLSYIGDTIVGPHTNIGAGVITCNYNHTIGNKNSTTIGARCDIGSNVNLIAPVTLEDDVQIAAGSTITQNVPANHIAHTRVQQKLVKRLRVKLRT